MTLSDFGTNQDREGRDDDAPIEAALRSPRGKARLSLPEMIRSEDQRRALSSGTAGKHPKAQRFVRLRVLARVLDERQTRG